MKKRILFLDAFSGSAGDMVLGALIDAGVPADYIEKNLYRLGLGNFELRYERRTIKGISGVKFSCIAAPQTGVRDYFQIKELISSSPLAKEVKDKALKIFEIIAAAESKIHGTDIESCHFHEVGALDSIVDIVGTALAIDFLRVDEVLCSPLKMGRGFVDTMHGRLPLPAPAVLEILKGVPVEPADCDGEWVTPTGAAIVKTYATGFTRFPRMAIERTGYGFGSRQDLSHVNALRVVIGAGDGGESGEVLIEVNLDDITPEVIGYVSARLLSKGALDVWTTPIYMKKNRPAVMLSIIAAEEDLEKIAEIIFRETTTIGLRFNFIERMKCDYEVELFDSSAGRCMVKKIFFNNRVVTVHPEYEDCIKLSEETGIPLKEIMDIVRMEYVKTGSKNS